MATQVSWAACRSRQSRCPCSCRASRGLPHPKKRIDQKRGLAWTLRNLGLAKLAAGDTDEAATCLRQTLLTYRELDSQGGIAIALEGLSGVASARSQPRRSARLLGAAAAIREAVGMPLSPNSRGIYERMLATAKAQLAASEWEVELAYGRTTPYEEAIAYALEEEGGDELETGG